MVYRPFVELQFNWGAWKGTWSDNIKVGPISTMKDIIGIWCPNSKPDVYILRKHPGLARLKPEESGAEFEDGDPANEVDD